MQHKSVRFLFLKAESGALVESWLWDAREIVRILVPEVLNPFGGVKKFDSRAAFFVQNLIQFIKLLISCSTFFYI